jgi:hypothetical protein
MEKLLPWNTRSTHLLELGKHLRSRGRYEPSYLAETEALINAVGTERIRFGQIVTRLPEPVQADTQVFDARRSLDMILSRLETAQQLLAPGGAHPAAH